MVCALNVDHGKYDVCALNVYQDLYDGLCI